MTISNVINFGSALQTYATVKLIKKAGFFCKIINFDYPSQWHSENCQGFENQSSKTRRVLRILAAKIGILNAYRNLRKRVHFRKKQRQEIVTAMVFRNFLNSIGLTEKVYDRNTILQDPPAADIYITGSDQTWNPRYLHTDYSFLLNFAPQDAPKISYAASFGASELFPKYKEAYSKYLKRYDRISVRESSGVTLVKELCGKDAVHVLDPTLMLDADEWSTLNTNKIALPEKFIFCYILDYVFSPGPALKKLIDHLSEITGLPVITCPEVYSYPQGRSFSEEIGPDGFIECFAKATFVVTTSFHGSAFSVNFKKDFFAVLNPNSTKDDRVRNFLSSVKLEHRGLLLPETDVSKITLADLKTDYTESSVCLENMRKNSWAYLKEALDYSARKCNGEVQ